MLHAYFSTMSETAFKSILSYFLKRKPPGRGKTTNEKTFLSLEYLGVAILLKLLLGGGGLVMLLERLQFEPLTCTHYFNLYVYIHL